jgi:hypothetical protein
VDHATHEPSCNPELGWGMMQAGSRNDDGTSEAAKSMHGRDVRGCCLWEEMEGAERDKI